MRAAIYIRVSTEEQAKEGYSVPSQESVCLRWLNENGHELVDTYIDDGYSSKNLKRPDMQRMLRDIPNRKFDLLVFWRMNRVTRVLKDKIHLFELFDQHRIDLKSMTEELDTTTAAGRMVTNILVSVAQGEREQTAENVHGTMLEQHIKGKRQGAAPPYGYDLVEGELVVNQVEAQIVRRIYHMYQNGFIDHKGVRRAGMRAIAVQLNHEGAPRKNGAMWNYSTIRYILMNPEYCGKLRWNYRKSSGKPTGNEIIVDGTHEPIIPVDEFEYVQRLLGRRVTDRKKATSAHPFSGILRCGRCGYGMVGTTVKKYGIKRYYRCLNRIHYGQCDMPNIREESVVESFFDALETPNIDRYITGDNKQESPLPTHQWERELEQIQKKRKKWQHAYANDVISLDDLRDLIKEDQDREKWLQEQLKSALKKETPRWSRDELLKQVQLLSSTWHKIENQQAKKNFLYDSFESITINSDVVDPKGGPGNRVPVYVTDMKFRS